MSVKGTGDSDKRTSTQQHHACGLERTSRVDNTDNESEYVFVCEF